MLREWARRAGEENRTDRACAAHAHLAYMLKDLRPTELGEDFVRNARLRVCEGPTQVC